MEEEVTEGKLFATFEKFDDFLRLQQALLAADIAVEPDQNEDREESDVFKKLCQIVSPIISDYYASVLTMPGKLDEYQEQSYLLDPFLEQLVVPVAECLKSHAKVSVSASAAVPTSRVGRIALLLYQYIKCRGYKTISQSQALLSCRFKIV